MKDQAQEFAERVAGQWCIGTNMDGKQAKLPGYDSLVELIANELRAGRWMQLPEILQRLEDASDGSIKVEVESLN